MVTKGSYQQGAPPPMMALPQYAASPERESSCLGQLYDQIFVLVIHCYTLIYVILFDFIIFFF